MGYRGWLWTWGTNYSTLEKEVQQMFTQPQNSQSLFSKHQVSYSVIGQSEISQYHPDINLWKNCTLSYTRHQVILSLPFHRAPQTSHCSSIHIDLTRLYNLGYPLKHYFDEVYHALPLKKCSRQTPPLGNGGILRPRVLLTNGPTLLWPS